MYIANIIQKKDCVDSSGRFTYTDCVAVKFAFMMDLQKFIDLVFTANDDLTISITNIPDEDEEKKED